MLGQAAGCPHFGKDFWGVDAGIAQKCCFSVMGQDLWNHHPLEIRLSPILSSRKSWRYNFSEKLLGPEAMHYVWGLWLQCEIDRQTERQIRNFCGVLYVLNILIYFWMLLTISSSFPYYGGPSHFVHVQNEIVLVIFCNPKFQRFLFPWLSFWSLSIFLPHRREKIQTSALLIYQ